MYILIASDIMPRTTLDLDVTVLSELRRRGQREGKSMGQVASELLAIGMAEGADREAPALEWRTACRSGGQGGCPQGAGRSRLSATLDTNVLVYASNERDPVHHQAKKLLERLATGPDLLYLFWPTLLGYVRVVTHPGILPRPLGAVAAVENVSALLRLPHVRTPGEADGFWDLYRATAGDRLRGNDVPDGHIATLMRQHGVRLIYTRDRGFRRFDGIQAEDPFA